jgi:hypothetical protein
VQVNDVSAQVDEGKKLCLTMHSDNNIVHIK